MDIKKTSVYRNKRCDECGKLFGKTPAFEVKPALTADKKWFVCKECIKKIKDALGGIK